MIGTNAWLIAVASAEGSPDEASDLIGSDAKDLFIDVISDFDPEIRNAKIMSTHPLEKFAKFCHHKSSRSKYPKCCLAKVRRVRRGWANVTYICGVGVRGNTDTIGSWVG